MYEPIYCLLVGDFVKAFSPLIAIGLAIVCLVIIGVITIIYLIVNQFLCWYDGIIREDAVRYLRSYLKKSDTRYPSSTQLERFMSKELRIAHMHNHSTKHCDSKATRELLRYLIAFGQSESSLVFALAEQENKTLAEVLWMRFYWRKEWWILWPEVKPSEPRGTFPREEKKIALRAFPESWLENEADSEIGRIIAMRTIALSTARSLLL